MKFAYSDESLGICGLLKPWIDFVFEKLEDRSVVAKPVVQPADAVALSLKLFVDHGQIQLFGRFGEPFALIGGYPAVVGSVCQKQGLSSRST